MMTRRYFIVLAATLMFAFASLSRAEPMSPTQQVQVVVDEVLAILKDNKQQGEMRRQAIRDAIAPHFDFRAMSQSALSVDWKKASPAQQDEFVELFKKLLENVYIVSMEEYGGQTVRYGKEKVNGKRASVETFILQPSGVETPVIYRVRLKQGEWFAYDVVVEGVSLVSNYRSTFRTIVHTEGIEGVLRQLEEKVATPASAGA
jgi:phospholipid transport system substrate-binding protein